MKVGFLGPEASFTHNATKTAFPNEELISYHSIPACIKGVEFGEVDLGVVPIENTIEGSVNTTVDYLFHQTTIPVGAEIVLPIYQQLMVAKENKGAWQETSKILSHPQALAQSQEFIRTYFPMAELEATPSTAYAASFVASHPDQKIAAIAPKLSAEKYDLEIVGKDIQDVAINQTRFWVIGSEKVEVPIESTNQKLTIALTMPNNMPGALHKALSAFSWREIDLSKIESRPLKTTLGEYFFLIDINVQKPQRLLENALEEIRLMGGSVKIFGNYAIHPIDGV
ncbi:prephenate dehydratase [Enterococcus haemoperoxidus ATCC BAA-382]|uniref:Prephenate dehydratase n=1 Tax=Enterococcus haemoperoxidus ATCC BAA-382 TaxID=1158608 RepID=R2QTN8_9ENTE|nr:prephenate dehydratase [Enterococcus haemoperoxidus]EOH98593.1 prephenate dehydratase [Enterococcus haemoperoxidus ATCC BAA-382]EOT62224.1 prephenate dehydratase [Enterococcus haemoperoxidus ATCC BAA-382]OJG55694.1 prephenate dehydratase [Enterococcus haemoperoxidus]